MSTVSTLADLEIVHRKNKKILYFRVKNCPKKRVGVWHNVAIVRQQWSKRKKRYFFCPRCCSPGAMVYLTGFGPRDIYCNYCIPLPSINEPLKNKRTRQIIQAMERKDYNFIGSILQGGYKDLLSYMIATKEVGLMRQKSSLLPDLRKNDARFYDLIVKIKPKDLVKASRVGGRLIYADGALIVR